MKHRNISEIRKGYIMMAETIEEAAVTWWRKNSIGVFVWGILYNQKYKY